MTNNEKCRNCKYLGDIYTPPTKDQKAIHLNGCFYFADGHDSGRQVMYLDRLDPMCEMFSEKEGEQE